MWLKWDDTVKQSKKNSSLLDKMSSSAGRKVWSEHFGSGIWMNLENWDGLKMVDDSGLCVTYSVDGSSFNVHVNISVWLCNFLYTN